MNADKISANNVAQIENAIGASNHKFGKEIDYQRTACLIDEVAGALDLPVDVMTAVPWSVCLGIDPRIVNNEGIPDIGLIGRGKYRGLIASLQNNGVRLDILISANRKSRKRVVVVRYSSNEDHQLLASRVSTSSKGRPVVELLELDKGEVRGYAVGEGERMYRISCDSGSPVDRAVQSRTGIVFDDFLEIIRETALADAKHTS